MRNNLRIWAAITCLLILSPEMIAQTAEDELRKVLSAFSGNFTVEVQTQFKYYDYTDALLDSMTISFIANGADAYYKIGQEIECLNVTNKFLYVDHRSEIVALDKGYSSSSVSVNWMESLQKGGELKCKLIALNSTESKLEVYSSKSNIYYTEIVYERTTHFPKSALINYIDNVDFDSRTAAASIITVDYLSIKKSSGSFPSNKYNLGNYLSLHSSGYSLLPKYANYQFYNNLKN